MKVASPWTLKGLKCYAKEASANYFASLVVQAEIPSLFKDVLGQMVLCCHHTSCTQLKISGLNWTPNGPAGAKYNVSEKGWMDTTSFHDWFTNFFIQLLPEGRPVVLIMDGHASHLSIGTIKAAVDNGMILLKLPSNSTHVLQPLDVGVYGPAKTEWEKILIKFAWQNLGIALSEKLFPMLLKQFWESDRLPASNMQAGFKKCGFMLFNPAEIAATIYESTEFLDTL